jgi:glycosyltransferase involved in cell wall biosynthesis
MYDIHRRIFIKERTPSKLAPRFATTKQAKGQSVRDSVGPNWQSHRQEIRSVTPPSQSPVTPRRARVLYIDHTSSLGGGELALLNFIRHLDQTCINPIVLLFSEGPLAQRLRDLGIETHVLPLSSDILKTRKDALGLSTRLRISIPFRALSHSFRIARFIRHHRIDLVHTNSLKSDIIGGLAGRLAHRRVIWHVRDRIDSDYLPTRAAAIFRFIARHLPAFVVANSQATLDSLCLPGQRRGPDTYRATPSTSCVVHGGIDCPAGPIPHLCPNSTPQIGLVGRISPWKGQHIFLQAAAEVRKRFPNARFQIIGAALFAEQEYETRVRTLASTLGLNDVVKFTGFRADIAGLIGKLDILVHASTLGEPFGQVVIEGMAAGKPVVATNGGGIPEIVVDGETGLLVPMGDAAAMSNAIVELLADSDRSHEMGRRGRQRVAECFTIQRTARKIEQIYRLILGPTANLNAK